MPDPDLSAAAQLLKELGEAIHEKNFRRAESLVKAISTGLGIDEHDTHMATLIPMKSKKPTTDHKPVNPTVASHGVPGFHHKVEPGDGKPLAGMELDADTDPARVDTGTGDQPANTGSRFNTAPSSEQDHE